MKSISNRFYLDYNATSPLAESVQDWIANGDFSFGNPSSAHQTGKKAKKLINETRDYLYSLFNVKEEDFHLFFHSGASEGINTLVRGFFLNAFKSEKKADYYFFDTDHSCVVNQRDEIKALGHDYHQFSVDQFGMPKEDQIKKGSHDCGLMNFTWVNNESGVVWPLHKAIELKQKLGCAIHVDSVQSVGKIRDWNKLDTDLDAYTFSAHKFGGMKGIGFSFMKKEFPYECFVRGGGQQAALRSGTENVMGIYSIKLALEDLQRKQNFDDTEYVHREFEGWLLNKIGDKGKIAGYGNVSRNMTTTYLVLPGNRSDIMMTALDLAGVEVSAGSACSSGILKPSRILKGMGFSEKEAGEGIRFSFSPTFNKEDLPALFEKLDKVLSKYT